MFANFTLKESKNIGWQMLMLYENIFQFQFGYFCSALSLLLVAAIIIQFRSEQEKCLTAL